MKWIILVGLVGSVCFCQGQSIVGTWQLTDEKSCLQEDSSLSETEKELLPMMGESAGSRVARTIRFDAKGTGEEGIFTAGKKKASDKASFRYKLNGTDLLLLDIKSGLMTQGLVVDTLTQSALKFHNAKRVCEQKTFVRIK